MLNNDYLRNQAIFECQFAMNLDHENVVKAFEYAENKDFHLISMEFFPDADYFKEKIENV